MPGSISRKETVVFGLLVLLLVVGAVWRFVDIPPHRHEVIRETGEDQEREDEAEPDLITVHLVGAVRNPGVYRLAADARVYELVEKGGGFSEEADREAVNQARPLLDGEQVLIHRRGDPAALPAPAHSSLLNINQAGASELTALPGIGDVRAEQIVRHREKHGLFTDPSEIMDVSGIGPAIFENIEDLITVY